MKRKSVFTTVTLTTAATVAAMLVGLIWVYKDSFTRRVAPSAIGTRPSGTVFYDRLRAQDGYNLVNPYMTKELCRLMTMTGEIVYDFPDGFCRFLKDGSLVVMSHKDLAYYGPDSNSKWTLPISGHHDMEVSPDEKEIFVIARGKPPHSTDELILGFDTAGKQIFEWNSRDHLAEVIALIDTKHMPRAEGRTDYVMHLNSIQVLPENPLAKVNAAFKPGNLLINCFRTQLLFVIDRDTKKIVWSHHLPATGTVFHSVSRNLTGAHTAKLLPNGRISFFHNGTSFNFSHAEFSSVIDIDPISHAIVHTYTANPVGSFFSKLWGSSYYLPNGNILISNSTAGSAFEATPEGRIVWEWINPESDEFGLANPIYRVERLDKERIDKIVKVWKAMK